MQRIMGMARKAITEYDMIQNGDRVAVGVSGGKDSVALTMALHWLRRFIGIDYEVVAITLDPCFGGVECDYSPLAELFERTPRTVLFVCHQAHQYRTGGI